MNEEQLSDLVKLMFRGINPNNGARTVAKTVIGEGITVSTVNTVDMGYETAILDTRTAHPVERYPSVADAILGHQRWCRAAPNLKKITKLGYGSLSEDQEIELVRN